LNSCDCRHSHWRDIETIAIVLSGPREAAARARLDAKQHAESLLFISPNRVLENSSACERGCDAALNIV